MAKLFFFDLETTGLLHWKNGIHQMSGCIDIDGVTKEIFDFKVRPNPKAIIEQSALDVAGVTKEQVEAYPTMQEVYKELIEILSKYVDKFDKKDKFYLIGFNNASFDNQFLRAFFVQNNDNYFGSWFWSNPLDVFIMATPKLMSVRHEMENFQLKTVAKKLGIEIDESRLHDAVYDIEITREIYLSI